jgi:glucoamylase
MGRVVGGSKGEGRLSPASRHARYTAGAVLLLGLVSCVRADGPPPDARAYPAPVPLVVAGLIGDPSFPGPAFPVSPEEARGASYLPSSSVLRLPDGRLRYLPPGAAETVTVPPDDPGAAAAVAASRAWLEGGTVPGGDAAERRISGRALLDLRLLTRPNGAALAGVHPRWRSVWPRDASFVAVAFAATGHHELSYEILSFLASTQEPDGAWEARYDAAGTPVLDGRPRQLDAVGWFPWAAWYWYVTAECRDCAEERAGMLWPAARAAAEVAVGSLGTDGLPPGGADYWEAETWRPNLGTAAPLRTGLRAAADLARRLGHETEARRYAAAAGRIDAAIAREFAPIGYPRTTGARSGADAAVNFLAPPFAPPDPRVEEAIADAAERLRAPNGGVLPGERWPQDPTVAWTPETALFALSAAAADDEEAADRWLGWLAAHRTSLGAFPEKVSGDGKPKSAAPLGWTEAIMLLALAAKNEPLPVPPVPDRASLGTNTPPLLPVVGALLCAGVLVAALVTVSWKVATRPRWRPGSGSGRL